MTNFRTVKKNGKSQHIPMSAGSTRKAGRVRDVGNKKMEMTQEVLKKKIKTAIRKLIPSGYDCVKLYETGYIGLYSGGCYNNTESNQGKEIFHIGMNQLEIIFEVDHFRKVSVYNSKEINEIAGANASEIMYRKSRP